MRPRQRDPVEAAQVRVARRRRHAAHLGRWETSEAAGQLTDLHHLATEGAAGDRDAEEHRKLVLTLQGRADAYGALAGYVHRLEQETP